MSAKVALVTGGNRGIGFEICRLLCKRFKENSGVVILTARDKNAGQKACSQLVADGYRADFVPMDVTSRESIQNAAEKIKADYNGLDVLINNAGILYSPSKCKDIPYAQQVDATLETNFYGVLHVCEIMFPLLNDNARVVNVSSGLGDMKLYGKEILDKVRSKELSKDGLLDIMADYASSVKSNTHVAAGWPDQDPNIWTPIAYCVSKFGVNVLTRILANECKTEGVLINSCCPGWCRTELGSDRATKSAEEGAFDIVEVTMKQSNGSFWQESKEKLDALSSNYPM